jgi:hypothetical protein
VRRFSGEDILIGALPGEGYSTCDAVDDLRVSGRARTDDEIRAEFEGGGEALRPGPQFAPASRPAATAATSKPS